MRANRRSLVVHRKPGSQRALILGKGSSERQMGQGPSRSDWAQKEDDRYYALGILGLKTSLFCRGGAVDLRIINSVFTEYPVPLRRFSLRILSRA